MILHNKKVRILVFLILGACLLGVPLILTDYGLHVVILAEIGIILALGLNIFLGYCGQIHFGAAAFYAIGSYGVVLLQARAGLGFFSAFALSVIMAGGIAYLIAIPLLRLRGPTLALGTVAFALAIYRLAVAWKNMTGGGDGAHSPPLVLFGQTMGPTFFYYFTLLLVIACILFCYSLESSKHGFAMKAIRDNEVAAEAMGINVGWYWKVAFMMTGLFCGLAGSVYAQYLGWIDPERYGVFTNVTVLLMVVVGGAGSLLGAVLGGIIIQVLPELLAGIREYNVIAYGLILYLILIFMPEGVGGFCKKAIQRLTQAKGIQLLGRKTPNR